MKRKILAALLAGAMMFSLVACGSSSTTQTQGSGSSSTGNSQMDELIAAAKQEGAD